MKKINPRPLKGSKENAFSMGYKMKKIKITIFKSPIRGWGI
jgi:hypothetical protein